MRSGLRLADDLQIENVIGFERRVGFKFAQPIPFRCLQGKQIIHAAVDRLGKPLGRAREHTRGSGVAGLLKLYACS